MSERPDIRLEASLKSLNKLINMFESANDRFVDMKNEMQGDFPYPLWVNTPFMQVGTRLDQDIDFSGILPDFQGFRVRFWGKTLYFTLRTFDFIHALWNLDFGRILSYIVGSVDVPGSTVLPVNDVKFGGTDGDFVTGVGKGFTFKEKWLDEASYAALKKAIELSKSLGKRYPIGAFSSSIPNTKSLIEYGYKAYKGQDTINSAITTVDGKVDTVTSNVASNHTTAEAGRSSISTLLTAAKTVIDEIKVIVDGEGEPLADDIDYIRDKIDVLVLWLRYISDPINYSIPSQAL